MIEWLPFDQLRERFRSYPPIGLLPRGFYSSIVDGDPKEMVKRAGAIDDCWSGALCGGLADTMPFSIFTRERASWFGGGFVFDVWFPTRADNDLAPLRALAKLPVPRPRPMDVRFEPLCGGPFGVARVGSRDPIYIPRTREEAVIAARLLNSWCPNTFAVIPAPSTPPPWLVVGPRSGPYISQVITAVDEKHARTIAANESRHGRQYTVERSLTEWLRRT
jgi:hypothetical protein